MPPAISMPDSNLWAYVPVRSNSVMRPPWPSGNHAEPVVLCRSMFANTPNAIASPHLVGSVVSMVPCSTPCRFWGMPRWMYLSATSVPKCTFGWASSGTTAQPLPAMPAMPMTTSARAVGRRARTGGMRVRRLRASARHHVSLTRSRNVLSIRAETPMNPGQGVVVRRNTNRILALVLLVVAGVTVTCNHDVGDSIASRPVRPVLPAATAALVGLDPGFVLTQPPQQLAVAGASLPRSGAADLTIAFLAFVTAAAADNGDGNGTRLDRSTPPPADTNGADDVFLAAVVNTERTIAGQAVPTAFTQGLAPVCRDPRCVRCHSFHYPRGERVAGHFGALPAGSNAGCTDCHKNADILVPGTPPT